MTVKPQNPAKRISLPLAEGNYLVNLEMLVPAGTGVQAWVQGRRLVADLQAAGVSGTRKLSFAVNLRAPSLPSPSEHEPGKDGVLLHPGEADHPRWSTTLEIALTPSAAAIVSADINPAPELPTVYLAGDSTVCDQNGADYASWGQMLPAFFNQGAAIANHAESGETIKSFVSALRLAKILATIKAGDWLLIQFAHNDQKPTRPLVYAEPMLAFPAWLGVLVAEARCRAAHPVLVTPVERRNFTAAGKVIHSHGDYPAAIRKLAAQDGLPVIDLHQASIELYERLGPEASARAFADQGRDRSHHNAYGAWHLARTVAEGLRAISLELAAWIPAPLPAFCSPDELSLSFPEQAAISTPVLGN